MSRFPLLKRAFFKLQLDFFLLLLEFLKIRIFMSEVDALETLLLGHTADHLQDSFFVLLLVVLDHFDQAGLWVGSGEKGVAGSLIGRRF